MDTRAVIFDMDGVLVDSYEAHFEAWKRLAGRLGQSISEAQFAAVFGRKNRDIIKTLWGDDVPEDEIEALGNWKEDQYREILRENFPAMDGAAELLDALKAAGFALAVGSSGPPENVAVVLDRLGREGLFDATVTGDEVRTGKPDPEVFLKAAEKLGVRPRCCAVVEDAVAGLEAARRAGMTPIALVGTAPRETLAERAALVADSLRDLSPEVIGALIDPKAARKNGV